MSEPTDRSGAPEEPDFEKSVEVVPPPARGDAGQTARSTQPAAQNGSGTPGASDQASKPQHKPIIIVGVDEHRVVDEAIAALAQHPDVYKRGGMLVRVIRDDAVPAGSLRSGGPPQITPMPLYHLRDVLTASADWMLETRDKDGNTVLKPIHPPDWAAREVDVRGAWPGVRRIEGVVDSPVLRPDGTILVSPGYDAVTGLVYEPNGQFRRVRRTPTLKHAIAAKNHLLNVVEEFPFASEAGRAGWLASVLTLFARPAFAGPAPMIVIDANTPGTGKGKLANSIALIFEGRPVPPTPESDSEGEERKQITAVAMAGTGIVMFDNLTRPLGSGALEAVLTSTRWRDRVLGVSKMFEGDVFALWMATGNNIAFRKRDTIRRTIHIRLETDMQDPEVRQVQRPELEAWVLANRPTLVAAALTILRAYCAAGRPSMGLAPWGSFEGWSSLVRNAVVWVGMEDPAKTRDQLARTADTELVALGELLVGWEELCQHVGHSSGGATSAMALEALDKDEAESRMHVRGLHFGQLRSALAELINTPHGKLPSAAKVGALLRRHKGRVVDGKKLVQGMRQGNNYWFVIATTAGGDGGLGGHADTHSGDAHRGESTETRPALRAEDDPAHVPHVHPQWAPPPSAELGAPPEAPTGGREIIDL